jgi:hypothetical protein
MPWSRRLLFLMIPLFLHSYRLQAQEQSKDTLYFYNETKIVGELLSISLGRIEFDADGVGVIKIKNTKIESIHATSRSFRVEMIDGEELQGYLMRSEKPGMVVINAIVESKEIAVQEIADLVYFGKTLMSRVTGNVSAGYTYTKSSQIGRLNTDGMVKYNTSKGQTQLDGDMIVTYDSVKSDIERGNATFSHEHTFAPLWGAIIILKYQRNLELGLEKRWQQAFAIGREFLTNKRQQGSAIAGIAINQESNQEGVEVNTSEALLQVNYDFFSFSSPNLTLSFVESSYFSLTEKDRVRFDGDITLDYEIISDFDISFQFYHNYDSRSPATNKPNIDYGFVAGLKYKF